MNWCRFNSVGKEKPQVEFLKEMVQMGLKHFALKGIIFTLVWWW